VSCKPNGRANWGCDAVAGDESVVVSGTRRVDKWGVGRQLLPVCSSGCVDPDMSALLME
jgi:hypothetical protein